MPAREPTPAWAAAAPRPWQSFGRSFEATSYAPLSATDDLRASLPIDVLVPADCAWHQLPDSPHIKPSAFVQKRGANVTDVASRRAARRARDSRTAAAAALNHATTDGDKAADAGSDATWAARKERIRALLSDEMASASDLKRELRRLLGYADATRNAACHDRAELASELQAFPAPFVNELQRLRARAAKAEAAGKGMVEVEPGIEGEDSAEDTLRAGKPGADSGAISPPPPAPPAMKSVPTGGEGASVAGEMEGVAQAGSELSRREKQQTSRRVEAAVASIDAGGSLEPLIELIGEGPYAAAACAPALEQVLLDLGMEGYPLKQRLSAVGIEATLVGLLTDADKKPSNMHRNVLNLLERHVEGYAPGAMAVVKAGGGARLLACLKAWSKPHVADRKTQTKGKEEETEGGKASGADGAAPVTGPAAMLPHLLLLLIAMCEASDEARAALARCGFAESLLGLLDGPARSEAAILSVEALAALGATRMAEMCEAVPARAEALNEIIEINELDAAARAALTPVSTQRREAAAAASADARHAKTKKDAKGAKGKLAARAAKRRELDDTRRGREGAPSPARSRSPGKLAPAAREPEPLPLVMSGEDAEFIQLHFRADGCRRALSAEEMLGALCATRGVHRCFVAVAVEVKWGALVEIGRTEVVHEEVQSLVWDGMKLELPEGTPDRVYLRFAVYESAARRGQQPKLVGTCGATVQQISDERVRGRGVPLQLRGALNTSFSSGVAGSKCGTLWIEACELIGFADEEPEAKPKSSKGSKGRSR